jgi:hypothetical protein
MEMPKVIIELEVLWAELQKLCGDGWDEKHRQYRDIVRKMPESPNEDEIQTAANSISELFAKDIRALKSTCSDTPSEVRLSQSASKHMNDQEATPLQIQQRMKELAEQDRSLQPSKSAGKSQPSAKPQGEPDE